MALSSAASHCCRCSPSIGYSRVRPLLPIPCGTPQAAGSRPGQTGSCSALQLAPWDAGSTQLRQHSHAWSRKPWPPWPPIAWFSSQRLQSCMGWCWQCLHGFAQWLVLSLVALLFNCLLPPRAEAQVQGAAQVAATAARVTVEVRGAAGAAAAPVSFWSSHTAAETDPSSSSLSPQLNNARHSAVSTRQVGASGQGMRGGVSGSLLPTATAHLLHTLAAAAAPQQHLSTPPSTTNLPAAATLTHATLPSPALLANTAIASSASQDSSIAAGSLAGKASAAPLPHPPGSLSTPPPSPQPATAEEVLAAADGAASRLYQAMQPLVVHVSGARASSSFLTLDLTRPAAASASGFVWDARGHVVTLLSAVRGAAEVKVSFADASTYTAKVVGWDAGKDVAVLRLSMPKQKLKELVGVPLGSSSSLAVGHTVYALGNASGLDATLTRGLVSGLGRELPGGGPFPLKGLIQVDAACSHQAGGMLLDGLGRVVGMVVAPSQPGGRATGFGLGWAVPLDALRGLVDQITVAGRATRPALGVSLAPPQVLSAMRQEGVLVLEVPPGSPGHSAGLRHTHRDIFGDIILGDIIVGLDARPVRHAGDLYAALDLRKAGDRVRLDILRDGKAISLTLVLGERGAAGALEE
ncbi:trypsin-like cysteine/serine peptidase domain-containing protein [Haematococcus lacustris]